MGKILGFVHHWQRCLLHIPVGIMNTILYRFDPHLGWALLVGFMIYELNEDWRITDDAFKDIQGWLFGLSLTGLGWWLVAG